MGHGRAQSRHTRLLRRVSRGLTSGAIVSLALVGIVLPASADDAAPLNAVSSTGGVATAEGSTSVQTGDIVTDNHHFKKNPNRTLLISYT